MPPLTRDATTALLRALRDRLGPSRAIAFEQISSRSWASATFTGARHEIILRLDGEGAVEAAARFAAEAGAAEFRMRGHVVADIAIVAREETEQPGGGPAARMKLEVLTVEDF